MRLTLTLKLTKSEFKALCQSSLSLVAVLAGFADCFLAPATSNIHRSLSFVVVCAVIVAARRDNSKWPAHKPKIATIKK
jgi:hypothetical protein